MSELSGVAMVLPYCALLPQQYMTNLSNERSRARESHKVDVTHSHLYSQKHNAWIRKSFLATGRLALAVLSAGAGITADSVAGKTAQSVLAIAAELVAGMTAESVAGITAWSLQ